MNLSGPHLILPFPLPERRAFLDSIWGDPHKYKIEGNSTAELLLDIDYTQDGRSVHKALDWIRVKAGKSQLRIP